MKPETYKKRLQTKSRKWLMRKLISEFNRYIRSRDQGKPCISCGNYRNLEAGHYYAAGNFSSLRFNEFNVNGQCKQCNSHLHGNLIGYREGLKRKYGEETVQLLEIKAGSERKNGFHRYEKFELIEMIMKYKLKEFAE